MLTNLKGLIYEFINIIYIMFILLRTSESLQGHYTYLNHTKVSLRLNLINMTKNIKIRL